MSCKLFTHRGFEIWWDLAKFWHGEFWHRNRKWVNAVEKNGTKRLAWWSIAPDFQFVKHAVLAKCNTVRHDKRRSACTHTHSKHTQWTKHGRVARNSDPEERWWWVPCFCCFLLLPFCFSYPRLDTREAGNMETSMDTERNAPGKACPL